MGHYSRGFILKLQVYWCRGIGAGSGKSPIRFTALFGRPLQRRQSGGEHVPEVIKLFDDAFSKQVPFSWLINSRITVIIESLLFEICHSVIVSRNPPRIVMHAATNFFYELLSSRINSVLNLLPLHKNTFMYIFIYIISYLYFYVLNSRTETRIC